MINFIKHRKIFFVVSMLTIMIMLGLVWRWGLSPGIDFTGGTQVELKIGGQGENEKIYQIFTGQEVEVGSVRKTGRDTYSVQTKPIQQAKWETVKARLNKRYSDLEVNSFETVGPVFGQELLRKTFTAVLFAVLALLVYIAWRFQNRRFGVAAIVALLHDVLVIVGMFALFGHLYGVEVDIMFVTAVLTSLAFSVHDTIVLFDRVREEKRRQPKEKFKEILNRAINNTLVRSLSTSLSLVFVLVSLLLLGGESIRWFLVALLIGTVSGAYSSPFVAVPLLSVWYDLRGRDL